MCGTSNRRPDDANRLHMVVAKEMLTDSKRLKTAKERVTHIWILTVNKPKYVIK